MYLKMIELDTNKHFVQKISDQMNYYIVLENGPKRNEKFGIKILVKQTLPIEKKLITKTII